MAGTNTGVRYTVDNVRPDVWLDAQKKAVNGFLITVTLTDYNETHEVRVIDQSKAAAKAAIEKLLTWRDDLATLGQ
jgi:hypothetical protein